MHEIILEDEQKNNLKSLYNDYVPTRNKGLLDKTLEDWKVYFGKINSAEGLALDEYTNLVERIDNIDNTLPGGYLCNFLEKKSRAFGPSRPGTSQQYMVHLNAPERKPKSSISKEFEKTYYIKGDDDNQTKAKGSEKEAQIFYDKHIKDLLKDLSKVQTLDDAKKIEVRDDYKCYEAKQVLQKIVVLSTVGTELKFIHIYDKKVIDFLFTFFFGPNVIDSSFYSKNNAIAIAAQDLFPKEPADASELEYWRKISSFLWDLANPEELGTQDSPNVIYYGAPGTGKTYTVSNAVKFVTRNDPSLYKKIQFHPSFTYEDFIDGLKPVGVTESGNMKFEFVNGVFKDFCIKAKENPEKIYYFIVDEINRANLSAVFGETLSLLEADYRYSKENKNLIVTQNCKILESLIKNEEDETKKESLKNLAFDYDKDTVTFGIPANIRFVGMMNDVDKSIDSFDLALRRRFKWILKSCDYDVIEDFYSQNDENDEDEILDYIDFCKKLNGYISKGNNGLGLGSSYEFGHSFFMKLSNKKITKENRLSLFNNYLKPTLREYLRGFFEETEIDSKLNDAGKIFGVIDEKKKETDDAN